MEKLEIRHIAAYLPYGIKIQHTTTNEIKTVNGIYQQFKDGSFIFHWPENYGTINASVFYKLILRPLSDLSTEYVSQDLLDRIKNSSSNDIKDILTYKSMSYLLELHFDIFGLIKKGLAISYSDVQSISSEV